MGELPSVEPAVWPRWRLVSLLAGLAVTGLTLVAGLVLAVFYAVTADTAPDATPTAWPTAPTMPAQGMVVRDRIAAEPMLATEPSDSRETVPTAELPPMITIPAPSGVGVTGVPTGFPHTPEGAVGQLAAINVRVIEAMSIPLAHQVHAGWALPGGVDPARWQLTQGVRAFLAAAHQEGSIRDETTLIQAIPAAGLVKGVDGPDWVVACVLLDVRASIVADARIGWGHCERMQWAQGRWLIAPGTPPAKAPSTWPGSQKAVDAGWRTWMEAEPARG